MGRGAFCRHTLPRPSLTCFPQTNVTAPAEDLIALEAQLDAQMRQGLLPALVAAAGYLDTSTRPKSAEANDLYGGSLGCVKHSKWGGSPVFHSIITGVSNDWMENPHAAS